MSQFPQSSHRPPGTLVGSSVGSDTAMFNYGSLPHLFTLSLHYAHVKSSPLFLTENLYQTSSHSGNMPSKFLLILISAFFPVSHTGPYNHFYFNAGYFNYMTCLYFYFTWCVCSLSTDRMLVPKSGAHVFWLFNNLVLNPPGLLVQFHAHSGYLKSLPIASCMNSYMFSIITER